MKKQNEDFMAFYLGLQRETNLQYRIVCLVAKTFSSCFTFQFLQSSGTQKGICAETFKMCISRTGHQNPELNTEIKLDDSFLVTFIRKTVTFQTKCQPC